ncbi:Sigma-54 interaction domain family [Verrucomicrobiia bacterium DG1235]|nr:Sigma-54 interaction domain family [Verrucomicrobiae bacterium DG1235]
MTNSLAKILLIEDDKSLGESVSKALRSTNYGVDLVGDGISGIKAAQNNRYDLIITDMRMPGADGLDVIEALGPQLQQTPIILTTAYSTPEKAIEATRLGAYEYLTKPLDIEVLIQSIEKALEAARASSNETMGSEALPTEPQTLIGSSSAMHEVYKSIGRNADNAATVLIAGETGVGKELVANALHKFSKRKEEPFVAINCAALPENLLESELFGYEKGAFTGADTNKAGCFEQSAAGTLFLDEIGDAPLSIQVKLLRVLQEKKVRRIGSHKEREVHCKIVAATHKNLLSMVEQKTFREDLFYRINVAQISIPPLRHRRGDIVELCKSLLFKRGHEQGITSPSISKEALQLLRRYNWPGNVRQLDNTISKLLIRSKGYAITKELVEQLLRNEEISQPKNSESLSQIVSKFLDTSEKDQKGDAYDSIIEAVDKELISQALARSEGNLAQASRWLGLSRLTLRKKISKLELTNYR